MHVLLQTSHVDLMVASDALVQQNADALTQKSASTRFFYDLDVEMESAENVVPNTLPFTTTELNQCASHLAIREGKPTAAVDFMMASGVVFASSKDTIVLSSHNEP